MALDPIVAAVRKIRDALAARYNYDLRAMMEDISRRQAASGRKVVQLPPRPVRKIVRIETPGEQQAHETAAS
jgi:hypothetical protein